MTGPWQHHTQTCHERPWSGQGASPETGQVGLGERVRLGPPTARPLHPSVGGQHLCPTQTTWDKTRGALYAGDAAASLRSSPGHLLQLLVVPDPAPHAYKMCKTRWCRLGHGVTFPGSVSPPVRQAKVSVSHKGSHEGLRGWLTRRDTHRGLLFPGNV